LFLRFTLTSTQRGLTGAWFWSDRMSLSSNLTLGGVSLPQPFRVLVSHNPPLTIIDTLKTGDQPTGVAALGPVFARPTGTLPLLHHARTYLHMLSQFLGGQKA
jgi:hypothetical protein